MAKRFKTDQERDAFLSEPRLAILMTNRTANAPMGVPVWFEWNGSTVEIFAGKGTPKLARIEKDPNISVLVTNHIGEREAWVAFDGPAVVCHDGVGALVQRLAEHYWDLTQPDLQAVLDQWLAAEDQLVRISLTPSQIRSGA